MPICSACVGSRQWALIAPVEVTNEKICMYRKKEQKPGAEDPRARKKSTMVLFYKKGDESVASNWRPISLQSAIYASLLDNLGRRGRCNLSLTMVLFYKKGDESVASNWRPISLQSSIYASLLDNLGRRGRCNLSLTERICSGRGVP